MATQSAAQQKTVARVMHQFKHRELEKNDGTPVEDPKQAIAIALHEAGASQEEDAATNRRNLRRSKSKERSGTTTRALSEGETTRDQLHAEAKRRGIAKRSRMSKAELQAALKR